ncbi:DUF3298 and DUF4163 domain-containing protein [Alkalibacillus aidingensis]|uniref:DUF3298 and DUF4163 domain-containing protein n=1 Tax=Alkalibacillus aidingensis TaxID=2747607 RepID=UPI001660F15E|nr:DUF3298 and DUF4163 domain-containing protein [Alkalibacillus aidingensis]
MGIKTVRYFLIALLVSMAVGYIFFTPDEEGASSLLALETESDTKLTEDGEVEESGYPSINIRTVSRETDTYSIYVQVPVFEYDELNEFFGDYAQQIMNEFFHEMEDIGRVNSEIRGNLSLKVDVYPAGDDLYSIVFNEETFTGGASVNQRTKVWVVDLTEGELVDRTTFFKDPREAQEVLFPMIEQKLKDSQYYSPYILEDELDQWLAQTDYYFQNMFIRDGHLVFKFNKYEVLAGVAGTPEVEILISDVEDLFKDEWLERIRVEDESLNDFYM